MGSRPSGAGGVEKAAFGTLVAMWIVVPLITSNLTWTHLANLPFTYDQSGLPKAVAVLLLTWFGLVLWAISPDSARASRRPVGGLLLLCALAVLLVSSIASVSPQHAFFGWYGRYEGFVTYMTYAGVFFLSVQVLTPSRWMTLARAAVYTGAVVAAYGLLQAFGIDPTNWLDVQFEATRSFASYGNPDFLSAYLIFPIGLGLVLLFAEVDAYRRWMAAVAALVCLFCEVATLARSGWVGAFLTIVIILLALRGAGTRVGRVALGVIVSVGVLTAVLTLTSPLNPVSRARTALDLSDAGVTGRIEIWKAGTQAFLDRPVLGSGPDTFFYAVHPHLGLDQPERADRAHNYPLQLLVTTGLPGAALLMGFIALVLGRSAPHAFRGARHLPGTSGHRRALIYLGAWAVVFGYLTALLAGISLPGISVFMWMLLGLLAHPLATRVIVAWKAGHAMMLAVFSIVLSLAAYGAFRAVAADARFLQARVAARSGNDYAGLVREAVRLNPVPERYQVELTAAELQQRAPAD
ncbi:MAG: hypothetical protein CVT60_01300 [Actinobacteria bacterium HGW-Actinobacteria-10]|nr:MAG: hypothetical protein CVT60_01300 [Actinobacteria bacterium HGW-Actinobacteria-10]